MVATGAAAGYGSAGCRVQIGSRRGCPGCADSLALALSFLRQAHEMPGSGGQAARHGCEFSTFFSCVDGTTPEDLLHRGICASAPPQAVRAIHALSD